MSDIEIRIETHSAWMERETETQNVWKIERDSEEDRERQNKQGHRETEEEGIGDRRSNFAVDTGTEPATKRNVPRGRAER